DGVYKSTDGGKTWKNMGLKDTRHIGDIQIHPHNPDVVYVAALGHAWGQNEERGVYRSTDGGESWEKVLYKSNKAGSHDISMDPNNPRIIYAAIWEGQRYPHAASSGGEDSGLWKTTDGGNTWTDITRNPGLPKGLIGKIGVAVSPAQSGRVWALVESEDGALFRSDDHGETWQRLAEDMDLRTRAWYYLHIYADPSDADTVWVLNMPCKKSIDGGKTFMDIPTPHGDNQDLWIDPQDSNRMIEGNDGGAAVSFNGGLSWSSNLNQPTAQFYHVTTDNQLPYNVYGSQQDNWAMRLPSIDFEGAISWKNYTEPGGGESGYIAIKPSEPYTVFGGGTGTGLGHGRLRAWNPRTGQARNVTVWPEVHGFGAGTIDHKYRFQWTFPIEVSPHDPDTLYVASNHVHKSTDEGASWDVISPDLTRNDPSKLGPSGGPITLDNSGAEIYCTIFAFHESPHEQGVFWVGTDDGLVHISRDGGANWKNITPPDLPEWAMINIIEPSPHDPATAYVAATRYKLDDVAPYLYKTNDYGESWTKIVNGIPADEFTRTIREDPARRGLLYCGTEVGLHVSFDDGANWERMQSNLPVCPIWDLVVKDNDLVVATHGRAFWILDDITPLHQMQDGVATNSVHLFKPRDTPRYKFYQRDWGKPTEGVSYMMTGPVTVAYRTVKDQFGNEKKEMLNAGTNPPDGVIIHYYLNEKPEGDVKLDILKNDEVVKAFSSSEDDSPLKPQAGANRFIWNMRYQGPTEVKSDKPKDRRAAMMEAGLSPRAAPGTYQVQLTVNGNTQTQSFNVLKDPRIDVSESDLEAQFNLKSQIRDKVSEVNEAVNQLRSIRKQVEEWEERTKGNEEIANAAKPVKEKLEAIENQLVIVKGDTPRSSPSRLAEKLGALTSMIEESDAAPTRQSYEVFNELSARVSEQQGALRQVIDNELAEFNNKVNTTRVPAIVV
ncbi:MAG: glycosyl hydrolase, partial [Chloroflexia bacterium]|nr:glycosyl hydrolase [Chloroflexia bacterium]